MEKLNEQSEEEKRKDFLRRMKGVKTLTPEEAKIVDAETPPWFPEPVSHQQTHRKLNK
jgi:hypothetical protein